MKKITREMAQKFFDLNFVEKPNKQPRNRMGKAWRKFRKAPLCGLKPKIGYLAVIGFADSPPELAVLLSLPNKQPRSGMGLVLDEFNSVHEITYFDDKSQIFEVLGPAKIFPKEWTK